MRSFLTVVVGFLLALSVLPLAHSEVGSRVALVIGNGAYQSVPKLRSPVDDAQAIDRALTALGFRVIRLENATKEQMEGAILELSRQLRPGATSLVYYSGYGINVDGRNYLLPVNAEITTPESLAIQAIGVQEAGVLQAA